MRYCLLLVLVMSPMVMSRSKYYITVRRTKQLSEDTKTSDEGPVILSEGWVKKPDSEPTEAETTPEITNDDINVTANPTNANKTHIDNLQIGAQVVADMKTVVGIIVHVTEQVVSMINRNGTIPYLREACKLRVSDQNNQHSKESAVNCGMMDNVIRKVENEPVSQDSKNPQKLIPADLNCMFVRVLPDSTVLEKKVDCASLHVYALVH